MESLLSAIAHARIEIPPAALRWALDAATPTFRPWTQLLGRSDVTDTQAWTLLWRDGKLEKSVQKIPPGAKGYWTSNASSEQLAEYVSAYLARPNVPPGTVGRVRDHFDGTVLTRLDLLRAVTRLGGNDAVCQELAAEPPVGSARGPQLGPRELALIERFRTSARREARDRAEAIAVQVSAILEKDDLRSRVEYARAQSAFGIEILDACLFGHGSVAPPPETADPASAEWLVEMSGHEMTNSPESFRLGQIVSAIRPIVRMHSDPADRSAQRWWPRRIRDFGPAGTVPLTFSIPSEEGDFIVRRLGNDVRRYQALADLLEEQPSAPLCELCHATDRLSRASGVDRPGDLERLHEETDIPPPRVPDLGAIGDAD